MQGSTYPQPRHQDEVGWLVLRSAAFTPEKSQVLILEEDEWTPGPVWTRRSEEKSPLLRHPGSNPGRPARSQAPCRLIHLAHIYIIQEQYYYISKIVNFYDYVPIRLKLKQILKTCHTVGRLVSIRFLSHFQVFSRPLDSSSQSTYIHHQSSSIYQIQSTLELTNERDLKKKTSLN